VSYSGISLQLMIPAEAAHDTVEALGRLGKLQFKDLNEGESSFKKTYASQIKRCDEMARQLRFLGEQVAKAGLPTGNRLGDRHVEFDLLENRLSRLEKEILELNGNNGRLQRSYNELLELQLVLETAGTFFEDSRSQADEMDAQREMEYTRESKFVVCVILVYVLDLLL
jgi:V-type H+-transporting ATPase subunit a